MERKENIFQQCDKGNNCGLAIEEMFEVHGEILVIKWLYAFLQ